MLRRVFCMLVVVINGFVFSFFQDSDDEDGGSDGKVKLDESTRRTWSMKSRDKEIDAEK